MSEQMDWRQAAAARDCLGSRNPVIEVAIDRRHAIWLLSVEVRLIERLEVVHAHGREVANHALDVALDRLQRRRVEPHDGLDAGADQLAHQIVVLANTGAVVQERDPLDAHPLGLGNESVDDRVGLLGGGNPVHASTVIAVRTRVVAQGHR